MDLAIALTAGLAAGVLAGLLGVGGGLIVIPAMVLLLGTVQHVAQGVALSVIAFTALVGAAIHFRQGNVKMSTALWIAPAAAAASLLGAWATSMVSSEWLGRAFAVFLLIVGLRMLLAGRGSRDVKTN